MKDINEVIGIAIAATAVLATPVLAKGIAPLATACGLSTARSATACPAAHARIDRIDRTRLTASSVSADGRRQLDQLIASLN